MFPKYLKQSLILLVNIYISLPTLVSKDKEHVKGNDF